MTNFTSKACYCPHYSDFMAPPEETIHVKLWEDRLTDWGLRCIFDCFEPFRPLFLVHCDLQSKFLEGHARLPWLVSELPFPTVYEMTREQADSEKMQFSMTTAWILLEALQLGLDYADINENAMEWVVLHAKTNMLAEDAMDNWLTAMRWVLGRSPNLNGIDEGIFGHP